MGTGGKHYIPRADPEFNGWVEQFSSATGGWASRHGFDDPFSDLLNPVLEAWRTAYPAHIRAQAAAQSATDTKAAAREALERVVRQVTGEIQTNKITTDYDRADLGVTVPDPVRTPSPAPTTRPRALVEPAGRLTHTLRFADESTPTRQAKPPGVRAVEVWIALGESGNPPPTESYTFLTYATRGTGGVSKTFPVSDGGKTAFYQLRWVSTRGEKGPWSDVVTATVAA